MWRWLPLPCKLRPLHKPFLSPIQFAQRPCSHRRHGFRAKLWLAPSELTGPSHYTAFTAWLYINQVREDAGSHGIASTCTFSVTVLFDSLICREVARSAALLVLLELLWPAKMSRKCCVRAQHAVSIENGSLLVLACTCLHPAKRTRAPTRLVGNTVIARPACDTAAVAARHTVLRAMRLGGASYRTTPSCCSPHRPVAAGLCTQLSPRGHNTPQLTPSSSQHHTTFSLQHSGQAADTEPFHV